MRYASLLVLLWACQGSDPKQGDPPTQAHDSPPTEDTAPPVALTDQMFSTPAQAALAVLRQDHSAEQGRNWNASADAVFDAGWLLQVPSGEYWGGPAADEDVDLSCDPATTADCHPDFWLRTCESDADCVDGGRCAEVMATVYTVGGTPDMLCVGSSDYIYDAMYETLITATDFADISSLDFPDRAMGSTIGAEGRFLAALRNGLRYLDDRGDPVTVRMVFGWLVNDLELSGAWAGRVAELTDGISADTNLSLYIAALNYQLYSWNHSKIFATDGVHLLTGGINFYTSDYLKNAPVHDLSVRLSGEPATDAHRYLDEHWQTVCTVLNDWDPLTSAVLETYPADLPCADAETAPVPAISAPLVTGARVITLGRHGLIDGSGATTAASDDAIYAAISAATTSLRFSLQDLGPVQSGVSALDYGWPRDLMTRLTWQMLKDVEVSIVLSTEGAGAYSYGWSLEDLLDEWTHTIARNPTIEAEVIAKDGSVRDFLCGRLNLASIRMNDTDAVWPSTESPMGNHSKFILIDDTTFVVGSQNLYLSNLFEWAVMVDDPALTATIQADYWDPLWTYSQLTAVSGPAAETCVLP